jgi:serine/threonine protein kinase
MKVVHGRGAPDAARRDRLATERAVLERLDHPNVVQMLDAGTNGSTDWIVLDYANAGSFDQVLREDGPLDTGSVVRVALQLLAALDAAHRKGIVHQSLDPAALLLGHRGRVLLAGFTLAARGDACAPAFDQARRRDLYDAVTTIVQLATGRPPPDLAGRRLGDPCWGPLPVWLRAVLQRGAGHPEVDPVDTAEELGFALVASARRFGAAEAEAAEALWEEVRPTGPRPTCPHSPEPTDADALAHARLPGAVASIVGGIVTGVVVLGLAAVVVGWLL